MVEFEETINRNEDIIIDTNATNSDEVRKRVCGVGKYKNKWRARFRHPKLKAEVHVGYYTSPEEAALALKKKKAEYEEKMFQGGENIASEETKLPSEVMKSKNTEYEEGMFKAEFERRKLPYGVYRKTRRTWGARIWHPMLKRRVSLGCFSTVEEAAMAAKNKRAEFKQCSPTSVFEPQNSNNGHFCHKIESRIKNLNDTLNIAEDEKLPTKFSELENSDITDVGDRIVINKGNQRNSHCTFGFDKAMNLDSDILNIVKDEKLPTMGFKPKNSNIASGFDEAMLGIVNEYGQLLGMYSELDEMMELDLPDEHDVHLGHLSCSL